MFELTGASKKNSNIMKKVNIFCHSFQKVKPIYYIGSLHRVTYFKPLFLDIWMIMLTDNENRKLEYYTKINKKRIF